MKYKYLSKCRLGNYAAKVCEVIYLDEPVYVSTECGPYLRPNAEDQKDLINDRQSPKEAVFIPMESLGEDAVSLGDLIKLIDPLMLNTDRSTFITDRRTVVDPKYFSKR